MSKSRTHGHTPFEYDAKHHVGYQYTTQAPLSATVANQRLSDLTLQWLRKHKKLRTIHDLGCGDGTYTAQLAAVLPKLTFKGIDPAATAIKLATQRYPDLSFKVGDLLKPSTLPTGEVAILRGVIHHVPNPALGIANTVHNFRTILIIEPNGWNPIVKVIEKTLTVSSST